MAVSLCALHFDEQPRDWQPPYFSCADPSEVDDALPVFTEEPLEVSVGRLRTVRIRVTSVRARECTCGSVCWRHAMASPHSLTLHRARTCVVRGRGVLSCVECLCSRFTLCVSVWQRKTSVSVLDYGQQTYVLA